MTHSTINQRGFIAADALDFDTIKANLKTFLRQQTAFEDFDFEGSNISVLLDLLAYNSYMNGIYLNMTASEMFLDTSQLRSSIVSHAKELNYIPRSRAGAKANVEIIISPGSSPSSIKVPKHYVIETVINNKIHNFLVPADIVIKPVDGVYTTGEITIVEGHAVTEFFTANTTTDPDGFFTSEIRFIIQSGNADFSTFDIDVAESGNLSDFDNGISKSYLQANSLFGLDSTSRVFFVQGFRDNFYEIVLGNGVHGRSLNDGEIVRVHYHDVVGSEVDGAFVFHKTTSIDGFGNIIINTKTAAKNGAERETDDSIKFNAIRHFQTQERAVTAEDYVNLILAKFPEVQAAVAFGGEDIKQFGKVIISVKPAGSSGIATDTLKAQIVSYLKLKSLTTEPIVVDAEFFYIEFLSDVTYDSGLATKTSEEIKSAVVNTIAAFNVSTLSDFGKDIHSSVIATAIDDADPSIISNDTDINIIKRWAPTVGVLDSLKFTYNNKLHRHDIDFLYPEGHQGTLTSSVFKFTKDGVVHDSYLRDDGLGIINIHTFNTDGTRNYLANNVGTVDYSDGAVDLTTIITEYTNYINIIGDLRKGSAEAATNGFLIIDEADITVNVIEST